MTINRSLRLVGNPLLAAVLTAGLVSVTLGCAGSPKPGGPNNNAGGEGGEGGSGAGGSGAGGRGAGGSGAGGRGAGGSGAGGSGMGGSAGSGAGGSGAGGSGAGGSGAGGTGMVPPAACANPAMDAPGETIDFSNNTIASPAPPGNLTPANAPQIVVFGWDDVENVEGITFVNSLIGGITNPDGKKAGTNLNPNSCYGVGYGPLMETLYTCGDGSISLNRTTLTQMGFDIANHTVDHLESNSTWKGIPAAYKDPKTNSWKQSPDGYGPGVFMDQNTWVEVLKANDVALRMLYPAITAITGFRAPRLEINDHGLNALKAVSYNYDMNLEEVLPDTHVDAAVSRDGASKEGFNWVPWPYTMDNGSPGIWRQQMWGDKAHVTNLPTGVWEVPVYMLYLSNKSGLGKTIADQMLAADKDCIFPGSVPMDQRSHCYLSEGELKAGDVIKEVTSFDFNTFIYGRFKAEQLVEAMKNTFLLRFHGNRAPLTYGAHPIQYTSKYDDATLKQANNYGYANVLKYNTWSTRQKALRDFVAWVQADPVLKAETYFMSGKQLVDYMKAPHDKKGVKVAADAVATPASNGIFSRLKWLASNTTINVVDGNSAELSFDVADAEKEIVYVSAGVTAGSLKNLSHIDIKYSTDMPFRIRLLTNDNDTRTVLLAGIGGDRTARIRIKDFFAAPDLAINAVATAGLVDGAYMNKVTGIQIESAATVAHTKQRTKSKTSIKQLTLHGANTAALCQ